MTKKDDRLIRSPTDLAAAMDDMIKDPPAELNERQRRIVNYKLRGLTQTAIAQLEEVSQPYIAAQLKKIREVYAAIGRTIDQEQVVGETVSLYSEVEQRAWEMFFKHKDTNPAAANKALDTVMTSRDKSNKLMMDLGILARKAIEHDHTLKVAPFFEEFDNMDEKEKQTRLRGVIHGSLNTLEEPEAPQLEADIEDADWEEKDDEDGV
jgi:phage terminase small subunit